MEIKPEEYKDYLEEQHLTPHEAARLLDVTEAELGELVKRHQIPTHTIAGAFTRLKKKDVEELKVKWRIERELFPKPAPTFPHKPAVGKATVGDKMKDFWYFNDFYIACTVMILLLLYFILSHQ